MTSLKYNEQSLYELFALVEAKTALRITFPLSVKYQTKISIYIMSMEGSTY